MTHKKPGPLLNLLICLLYGMNLQEFMHQFNVSHTEWPLFFLIIPFKNFTAGVSAF